MTEPQTIHVQVKDKDGVYLASVIFDYPTGMYLRESLRLAWPMLSLHTNTAEILVNQMGLEVNGVPVQKGIIQNPVRLRNEHYLKTGN